jgi:hypothetical protein
MRRGLAAPTWITMSIFWTALALSTAYGAGDTARMAQEELKGRLGDPAVVIVDVRTEGSWKASESKIKGAVREDPARVENWIKKYPKDKTLVFYCS